MTHLLSSLVRRNLVVCFVAFGAVAACPSGMFGQELAKADEASKVDFFESKIRPALIQYCYECHSAEAKEANGGLLLDSQPAMVKGGERGNVMAGEDYQKSLLWRAINYHEADLQMPPSGKMPEETIAVFREWMTTGAVDPRKEATSMGKEDAKESMESKTSKHWAYQPPVAPAIPEVKSSDWIRNDIDRFILAKLEKAELPPSPEASRRTLIRRLSVDLTGLPPTYEEILAFEQDNRPDAYEKCVERLLDQPHFGERFARYWMDIVRYADNKGYVFQEDREYAHAYRYRDWLIKAFNSDMGYDRFLQLQLAADRLDPENKEGHLDAMGMMTLGRRFLNNQNDIADDRIDVMTRGFMAMTVGCARCHDHKFDPVKMADYYSLHGVLVNSKEPGGDPSPLRMVDKEDPKPTYIFLRGQPGNRGDTIERKFVSFLSKEPVLLNTGSGRIDVANAIASQQNPLTARVYVNRVWDWIMGAPFVDSTSDFGLRCESPLQQDLLDHLSVEFVRDGWSTKKLIHRIVTSATYRQISEQRSDGLAKDPENRLWWKANRGRMELESYLDAMLVTTGEMDRTIGGSSVKIHEAPFPKRRTMYAYIDRQNLPGLFRSFDFANPDSHSPRRAVTTVPQQGLFALNSGWVRHVASRLGDQANEKALKQEKGEERTHDAAIKYLFQQVLARNPEPQEWQWAQSYLAKIGPSESAKVPHATWRYGYGTWNREQKKLEAFQDLPVYANKQWRGGQALPDPKLGWVMLDESGGHPGGGADRVAIRRWTAPHAGKLRIDGQLQHPAEAGDGIKAYIVKNGSEVLGEWSCKNGKEKATVSKVDCAAGDTIDFIVDCGVDENSDGFKWSSQLFLTQDSQEVYRSKEHFAGSELQREYSAYAQLAQALLATNEFCFVD